MGPEHQGREIVDAGVWSSSDKNEPFGSVIVNCHPLVEKLAVRVELREKSAIRICVSVLKALRRVLEEITGVVDAGDAGRGKRGKLRTCMTNPQQRPNWVDLESTRGLHVHHEASGSYPNESGLKPFGTKLMCINKGDTSNRFVRTRLVALTTELVDVR